MVLRPRVCVSSSKSCLVGRANSSISKSTTLEGPQKTINENKKGKTSGELLGFSIKETKRTEFFVTFGSLTTV